MMRRSISLLGVLGIFSGACTANLEPNTDDGGAFSTPPGTGGNPLIGTGGEMASTGGGITGGMTSSMTTGGTSAATGGTLSTGGNMNSGNSGGDTNAGGSGGDMNSGGSGGDLSTGGDNSGGSGGDLSTGGDNSGGSGGDTSSGGSGGDMNTGGTGGDLNGTPVAWLYQHCPFDGWSVALAVGEYTTADLAALGAPNNDASSLQVTAGYEVILYDGDDFSGSSVTLASDSSCMTDQSFNDLTSSLIVREATGGTGGAGGAGGTGDTGGAGGTGGSGGFGGDTNAGGTGGTDDNDDCRLMLGDVPACCTPQGQNRTNVDEVFELLNAYRVSLGLNALAVDAKLEEAMQGHCMHMAQADFFDHSSPTPGLVSPWDRAGYCGTSADAENIAAGHQTPAAVMEGWKNSSGHDSNMRGNHTVVGIGEYERYWGQIFR